MVRIVAAALLRLAFVGEGCPVVMSNGWKAVVPTATDCNIQGADDTCCAALQAFFAGEPRDKFPAECTDGSMVGRNSEACGFPEEEGGVSQGPPMEGDDCPVVMSNDWKAVLPMATDCNIQGADDTCCAALQTFFAGEPIYELPAECPQDDTMQGQIIEACGLSGVSQGPPMEGDDDDGDQVARQPGVLYCDNTMMDGGRGGRANTDQVLSYRSEEEGIAQVNCESMVVDGTVFRTATQMRYGDVGVKSGWQSANPLGEARFGLVEVNGQQVYEENDDEQPLPGLATITTHPAYEKYNLCDANDGEFQFSDGMCVVSTLKVGAVIRVYSFRDDTAKETVLAGETLFSIDGSMNGCKLEIVVELPVPSSGDFSFKLRMFLHHDTREAELMAGLTHDMNDAEPLGEVVLTTSADPDFSMTMSKKLICKNTEQAVTGVTITDADSPTFTFTVPRANVENCGSVFFDPKIAPMGASAGRTAVAVQPDDTGSPTDDDTGSPSDDDTGSPSDDDTGSRSDDDTNTASSSAFAISASAISALLVLVQARHGFF